MKIHLLTICLALAAAQAAWPAMSQAASDDSGRPQLETRHGTRQLVVDGKPFLMMAGELHNSSATSRAYMEMKTSPQPQGKAFYLRSRNSLVFLASNMPALPPERAYELWLIPTSGNPIPAGLFKPDAHGNASVVNPPLPPGTEAKAFAITVENQAGSEKPTTPILMMGAGE